MRPHAPTEVEAVIARDSGGSYAFGSWRLVLHGTQVVLRNTSPAISVQRPRILDAGGAEMLEGHLPRGGRGDYWQGYPLGD